MKKSIRMQVLASTLLAGAATFSMPAFAQDQAPEVGAEDVGEAIVVTGSRIANPDMVSNSPISMVGSEVLAARGTVNVEDALNLLPQVTPGFNSNTNNGGDGTATIDLRGIGPSRTLVLVNGRRFVPSSNQGRVDLNNIPSLLIERVDVVTGGASAVYGSDALAGVVNFVLKNNFEGVKLDAQYKLTSRGDGSEYSVGGIFGANLADGRGNVTVGASYLNRRPLFQSSRSFFAVDQTGNGSATGNAGRFDNSPFNPFPTADEPISYSFNPDGTPRPFVNALPETNGGVGDRYNFAPVNYLQTPQKRLLLNMLAHYDVNDSVEAFAEGSYANSRVTLQLAPTPVTNILVDPTSSALSQEARDLLATRADPLAPAIFRRRMSDVGARIQDYEYNTYQINAGFRGDLNDRWNFEIYYAYGRTESTSGLSNDVSKSRLVAGLNGCPTGSPAGCLSLGNAFGGTLTQGEADYIRIGSSVDRFTYDRKNVVATISGELIDLPAGPVGIALGTEYRKDSSTFRPSEASRLGDLGGFNAAQAVDGSFNVKEFFGEIKIPLLADKPFFHALNLEGGVRYSDYNTVGGLWTYKAGGDYSPVEGFRIRGLYSRSVRAPSIIETFQAGDQGFYQLNDPCATISAANVNLGAPTAAVAAICTIQGLPDVVATPLTQLNSQVEAQLFGNRDLKAETSDTYTIGAVLAPRAVPGFSLSVDYFNINVKDYISRLGGGAASLVSNCFSSGVTTAAGYAADPFCSNITRTQSGELFLQLPYANTSKLKTKGIDFQASYRVPLDFWSEGRKLNIMANVTWLDSYKLDGTEYAGASSYDFLTMPEWRSNVRFTLPVNNFDVAVNWQRVGKVFDEAQEVSIASQNYIDLSLSALVDERLRLTAGMNNAFDNKPPLVLTGVANSDTGIYQSMGRTLFVGASIQF